MLLLVMDGVTCDNGCARLKFRVLPCGKWGEFKAVWSVRWLALNGS